MSSISYILRNSLKETIVKLLEERMEQKSPDQRPTYAIVSKSLIKIRKRGLPKKILIIIQV